MVEFEVEGGGRNWIIKVLKININLWEIIEEFFKEKIWFDFLCFCVENRLKRGTLEIRVEKGLLW